MNDHGPQSGFGQTRQPLVNPPTYIQGGGEGQDQETETANASPGVLSWDEPSETTPKDPPHFVGLTDKLNLKNEANGDAKPENIPELSPAAKGEVATPESDDSDGGDANHENEVPEEAPLVEEQPSSDDPVEIKKSGFEEKASGEENDSVPEPTISLAPEMLPDLTPYTHTIEQASALMKERCCKYHSERKVQRLCQDGKIDCYRLKTSRNGTAVTEWLVNGSSLARHIQKHEKKIPAEETSLPPVATPNPSGDAKTISGNANSNESEAKSTDAKTEVATPKQSGDAKISKKVKNSTDAISDLATPNPSGDAKTMPDVSEEMKAEAANPEPVSSEQNFVQSSEAAALIEKAELLAKLELKEEIIADLREDKASLKDQVEDHRANEKRLQQDLKDMAQNAINQTLSTLQNIALGGVLTPPNSQTDVQANQPDQELDNPQIGGKSDGV